VVAHPSVLFYQNTPVQILDIMGPSMQDLHPTRYHLGFPKKPF